MKRTFSFLGAGALLCVTVAATAPGCGLMFNYDDFETGTGGSGAGSTGSAGATTASGGGTTASGGGGTTASGGGNGGTGGTVTPGPLGAPCDADGQCESGHCADGVCCDSGCDGLCQTCKGGDGAGNGLVGTCQPILDGADPDGDCNDPDTDVCNGAGQCRCHDGVQNGGETCTDCGGGADGCKLCAATWVCGNSCSTGVQAGCCSDTSCNECLGDVDMCMARNGSQCEANSFGTDAYFSNPPVDDANCMSGRRCVQTKCTCTCPG